MAVVTKVDLWKSLHTIKKFCKQYMHCDSCPLLTYRKDHRWCRLSLLENNGDFNNTPESWHINDKSPEEYKLFP